MRAPLRLAFALALAGIAACSGAETAGTTGTTSTGGTGGAGGSGGSGGGTPVNPKPVTPVSPLFIGSGGYAFGYGSAFPGASAPAGLAKVGPDTKGPWGTIPFLHFSGYWYDDDIARGFSHLHLHGTGATDYGVLAMMPSDGFDAGRTTADGYESKFAKSSEKASPGKYELTLERGKIHAEITATTHAAHHRYTWQGAPAARTVIFDLDHHLSDGTIKDAEFTLFPAEKRIRGRLRSVGGMSGGFGGYDVFFEARSKAAWASSQVWSKGVAPAAGDAASGEGIGFVLDYGTADTNPVEITVGLSLVSGDEAAANLDAEIASFDFDATAQKTAAQWQDLLDRVHVEGGTPEQRDMITAATYHLFLMPSQMSDVSGKYVALNGQIQSADGYRYLSDMSLWDTYRTLHPLYAIMAPEYALDSVKSLHEMAKAGGYFPKWPIATGESGTMLGASAEVVIADSYIKGVKGFDAEGAYGILRAAAMDPVAPAGGRGGRNDVEPYMQFGYVPSTRNRSVSMTTEYAVDDFSLASLAEALGHDADAKALRERGKGYRKLYDPETGFLWAKDEAGAWATSHADPTFASKEFAEANAWQSLWMVAHDIDGLAELAGGRDKLVAKLDEMFVKSKEDWDLTDWSNPLTTAGTRPYYWAANEPDINAPYVFAQLGRPDLTQKWVAWSRANHYGPGADGLPGNDDGGAMSAWLIFSSLGFYPIPGTLTYIVGTPLFPHAELAVPGGTFTIDAKDVSEANIYVQSVTLNGAPLAKPTFQHGELKAGGKLEFVMGAEPSSWGRD